MSDLIHILNTLVDINGKILVTGLYQDVAPITDAEKETYRNIDFKPSEFQSEIGCNKLLHNGEKVKIVFVLWFFRGESRAIVCRISSELWQSG